MPIHFMHKSVNFDELIALYAVSDVCVVSSTRDGMNLVSYEYIASQQKRHGVLVLSEFTGAAQSLNGSILVNPWNTEELAGALQEAVTMSNEQRAINFSKLNKYVSKYTRYSKASYSILIWAFANLYLQRLLGPVLRRRTDPHLRTWRKETQAPPRLAHQAAVPDPASSTNTRGGKVA
jgi:glycosyltransferase involved in cell wall biosynthesis